LKRIKDAQALGVSWPYNTTYVLSFNHAQHSGVLTAKKKYSKERVIKHLHKAEYLSLQDDWLQTVRLPKLQRGVYNAALARH
jgi:hypothetical protein